MVANSAQCMALKKAVQRLQGSWISEEGFSFFNGQWLTSMQIDVIPGCQHLFRQHWRRMRFTAWLQSNRIDSQLAREQGVQVTEVLIDRLKNAARACSGDQMAVLCGGITTDAHIGGLRDYSPDCGKHVCPSTLHVLWGCEKFQDHLVLVQPQDSHGMESRKGSYLSWPNGHHSCTRRSRKDEKSGRSGWGPPRGSSTHQGESRAALPRASGGRYTAGCCCFLLRLLAPLCGFSFDQPPRTRLSALRCLLPRGCLLILSLAALRAE